MTSEKGLGRLNCVSNEHSPHLIQLALFRLQHAGAHPIPPLLPRLASAVMTTGRKRANDPSAMASASGMPLSRRWRMAVIITRPLSVATPDRAMKLTAAEMEKGRPRKASANTPPAKAKGLAVITARTGSHPPSAG